MELYSYLYLRVCSTSDSVLLPLKALPSLSDSPCLDFDLRCFCSNCVLLRYIVAHTVACAPASALLLTLRLFLCAHETPVLRFQLCYWISLCDSLVKAPQPSECQAEFKSAVQVWNQTSSYLDLDLLSINYKGVQI